MEARVTDWSSTQSAVPATKRSLLTLSHAMERAFDIADQPTPSPALVIGLFQRREYFDVEAARYAAMAAAGTCVVVGFVGSTQGLPPGVHSVAFTEHDPRSRDWVLITVKGAYASSLVATDARDLAPGEPTLEAARLFHARWTFQRQQALTDAHHQLAALAPDLPDALRSIIATVIQESRSHPVSAVEAGLGAVIDHVLTSLDAGHHQSNRLRAALESVQSQAERDALTGLHNRHFLQRFLGAGDRPTDLVTMLVDVDDLKKVNDTHGHAAGDAVLTAVADTLRNNTRPGDVIIRWGGDEFLLLVPDLGHLDGLGYAARLADAVRAARPAPPWDHLPISVSIGACPTRRTPLPLDQLDQALWTSKRAGKGRATYLTPEDTASRGGPEQ